MLPAFTALPITSAEWRSASDAEVSHGFLSIAKVYRSQAEVLKAKKKAGKSGVDREWPISNGIPNLLLVGPNLFSGDWPRPRRGDA
jgi:hypothetical protein